MLALFSKKAPNKDCFCCSHLTELKILEEEIISIQKSQANLRKDIRQIIHDEILWTLDHRARRVFPV